MSSFYRWFYEKLDWSKEQTDQNMLVAGIVTVVLFLLGFFFLSVPWAKPVAIIVGTFFVKAVVYVVAFLLLVLGLSFLAHFGVRKYIEHLDERKASNIPLQPWVHWLLNVTLSVFCGWLWSAYAVEFFVSIPGYVNTTFVTWGWYVDGVIQGAGWWWTIGTLAFFFGYFWKGIKESA